MSQLDKAKNVISSKQSKLDFEYDHSGVSNQEEEEEEVEEEDVEEVIFRKIDDINVRLEKYDKQIEELTKNNSNSNNMRSED